MKRLLLSLGLLSLFACKDSSEKYTPNLKDTSWVTILYKIDVEKGLYDIAPAQKTYVEQLKPDPKDSTRNIKVIDSAYKLGLFAQRYDTLRKDSLVYIIPKVDTNGFEMKRFMGLRQMRNEWIVRDFGKIN